MKIWENAERLELKSSIQHYLFTSVRNGCLNYLKSLQIEDRNNRKYAENFIKTEIPEIHAIEGEATYLLWLDCREVSKNIPELADFIREKTGLYLSDGKEYRNGTGFLRMNLACQRSILEEGLQRLKKGIAACINHQ